MRVLSKEAQTWRDRAVSDALLVLPGSMFIPVDDAIVLAEIEPDGLTLIVTHHSVEIRISRALWLRTPMATRSSRPWVTLSLPVDCVELSTAIEQARAVVAGAFHDAAAP